MKKLTYCSIFFMLFLNSLKAQFTLEQVYDTASSSFFYYNQFQQNGEKYIKILFPDGPYQTTPFAYEMRIYNLDHSIWKVIDLSNLPRPQGTNNGIADYFFLYVSDSLFNGDNLVEFLYTTTRSDTGTVTPAYVTKWNTFVFNENQTLLFSDTTAGPFYARINIPQIQVPIVKTSEGTKMMLSTPEGQVKVYGLEGSLPTQYESLNSINKFDTYIYPNPSSNRASIKYTLPNGIDKANLIIYDINGGQKKSYLIDTTFDRLNLSTEDLLPGTYFYVIQTSNGEIINGKKFITISN